MRLRSDNHVAARAWLAAAERGDLAETKTGPAGWAGVSWAAGPAFTDWNRTRRAPAPPELVEAFKQIVFACATLNANAVARTPLRLYVTTSHAQHRPKCLTKSINRKHQQHLRHDAHLQQWTKSALDIDEVTNHPLLDSLDRVNPDWDHNALIRYTVFCLDVIGRAYWWMEPAASGNTANVWPLLAQYVLPIRDPNTSLVNSYRYFDHDYLPQELVRVRHSSLRDPYALGLAPAEAAFAHVGLADLFVSIQENLLSQGARPSLLVSNKDPAEPIGKEERARLQRDINTTLARGGTGLAWVVDGAIDVKTLSFPPADLAALQISENALQRVANCFGVPLSLLKTEDVNLANAEAGHRQHAELAVDPRCALIASALTRWTRAEGRRIERALGAHGRELGWDRLFWAFDNPVKEDQERTARVHDLYVRSGVLTVNEVRAELGYAAASWGDEPWMPSSLTQPSIAEKVREFQYADEPDEAEPAPDETEAEEAKSGGAAIAKVLDRLDRVAHELEAGGTNGGNPDAFGTATSWSIKRDRGKRRKRKPRKSKPGRAPRKPGHSGHAATNGGHGGNPNHDPETGRFTTGPKQPQKKPKVGNAGVHAPQVGKVEVHTPSTPRPSLTEVPSIKSGEFSRWFNELTSVELDKFWSNSALREKIEARLRAPGGMHEWHMVSRAPTFKRWGVTAEQIAEMRTPISQVRFKNPPGRHGGPGSARAHNEILDIIDTAQDYATFKQRLRHWANDRLEGGEDALPLGLKP